MESLLSTTMNGFPVASRVRQTTNNKNSDVFVSVVKIFRQFPLTVLLLMGPFALYFQGNAMDNLKVFDNIQVSEPRNDASWYTKPLQHTSYHNSTIRNGHEAVVVLHPRNRPGSFQGNGESPELDDDNGNSAEARRKGSDHRVRSKAKSMDGISSTHMARDGAWVKKLAKMLKCNRKSKQRNGENTYARIPTKETWYVHIYWEGESWTFRCSLLVN
jgi:hypothetical protein